LSSPCQHTLAAPTIFAGVGLHTGRRVRAALVPAPAGAGITFMRADLGGRTVPARAGHVVGTRMGTVLGDGAGVTVSTVEHLMAALAALEIDNLVIELDGPEVPIMDGSCAEYLRLMDHVGRRAQDAPRRYLEVVKPLELTEGPEGAGRRVRLSPAPRLELAVEIDFDSPAIGRQRLELAPDEAAFRRELADARTFGFEHEVEALHAKGLALGGSLENAVVVGEGGVLNPEGLRWPDEFVRHKAADALGDLYLLGFPLIGRFEAVRAGHALHNAIARELLARPDAWRLRAPAADFARAV
jgi:UDP-3-O-[3-hydroxymyristoyl] N-acetylglucosamine deacetylase